MFFQKYIFFLNDYLIRGCVSVFQFVRESIVYLDACFASVRRTVIAFLLGIVLFLRQCVRTSFSPRGVYPWILFRDYPTSIYRTKTGREGGRGEGGDVRLRNEGLGYRGWPQSREYSLRCKKKMKFTENRIGRRKFSIVTSKYFSFTWAWSNLVLFKRKHKRVGW